MPLITNFYIFLAALFTSLVLIPPISRMAVSIGFLDKPDARKVHLQETPRFGGIAIFLAFVLALLLFCDFDRMIQGIIAGAVIIFITGLLDDMLGLLPRYKLIGQTVAAAVALFIGDIHLNSIGNIFGHGEINLGLFAIPFTIFCIVGVSNAVNLLDGLDGLAGGVVAIATATFIALAFLTGNDTLISLGCALLGGILGFLKYNTYPARIFMGDGGSLLLGYCMGIFSVLLIEQGNSRISEITPLIILALPVFDTLFVMLNRRLEGKKIFFPDQSHIHHRLMGLGLGHKATVILVYVLSYALAAFAVAFYSNPDYQQAVALGVLIALFICLNSLLASGLKQNRFRFLRSNQPVRQSGFYRKLLRRSHMLKTLVKYIAIAILILAVIVPIGPGIEHAAIPAFLFLLSLALIFATNDWGNRFLLFILYFDGAYILYQMENYGRNVTVLGVYLSHLSNFLFALLVILLGVKLFLRRSSGKLMNSPLEYFILFIVISTPMLPKELVAPYHLLSVAAKSVILFVAYKLVLMTHANKNRKIILATLLSLLVLAVRTFF